MQGCKKIIILFLSLALLFPAAVSVSHIYAHEKTFACQDFSDTHIHKKTIDCDICKIKKASSVYFIPENHNYHQLGLFDKRFYDQYNFLSNYQKLSFELRGPPATSSV